MATKRFRTISTGKKKPTMKDIKEMRRLVYKNLVETNPKYVEKCLRKRLKDFAVSLRYLDPTLTTLQANTIAKRAMWWAPQN